jgi:hypothetical protein
MLVVYIMIIIDFLFGEDKTPPKILKKHILKEKSKFKNNLCHKTI